MLSRLINLVYIVCSLSILLLSNTGNADELTNKDAQTILHMLDYVTVDYGGSVLYGKVLNEREFNEQIEFAEQAATLMNKLPENPNQAALIVKAVEIAKLVKEKAAADYVSALAQALHKAVIETYQIPVAPRHIPDSLPALALYQQLCAPCHGTSGHGDGPLGKVLTPKPADFHNDVRMGQRSVYGLYNSISLGVMNTSMPAFTQLSDEDRWGLAFLVSNFRITSEQIERGRKIWEKRSYKGPTPDLAALTILTGNEISARYGDDTRLAYKYLRSEPKALLAIPHATLIFAAEQLDLAVVRYREGNQNSAQNLAIAAYLEGFQPMEISLDTLDIQLRRSIEIEMMNLRQLISGGAPIEAVTSKVTQTKLLLKRADERLRQGDLSVLKTFSSGILILLRESLGAILVLAGLIAFVTKIGQRKAQLFIYAGCGIASILGGLTWAASTWMTELSGFSREITSAITALISSAMLIYFGFWLYNKTHWQTWQDLLLDQKDIALRRRILWSLAFLSFFVIYRASFQSALFYEALWIQTSVGTKPVIWSGILTAALVLFVVGWGIYRFGLSLSSKKLFTSTSLLLASLSVVFAGQGVTSLQKAGMITASPVGLPYIPFLGVTPTIQTLMAQLGVIGIVILGLIIGRQYHKREVKAVGTSV